MDTSADDNRQPLKAFDRIWAAWSPSNIPDQIEDHRRRRVIYLNIIKRWMADSPGGKTRVLEFGCGSGIDAHILAQDVNAEFFGVDISPASIDKAQKVAEHFDKKVNLQVQDGLKMTFDSEYFDLVFSQGVLEHFKDPNPAITEQLRVLKPGGTLIISVPQTWTSYTVYKHILMNFNKWPWGRETEYSVGKLKRLAKPFDLAIMEVTGYDYWRHMCEPMWVLRSLNHKRRKLIKTGRVRWLDRAFERYDAWFDRLEKMFGAHFMKNVVIVYRKRA